MAITRRRPEPTRLVGARLEGEPSRTTADDRRHGRPIRPAHLARVVDNGRGCGRGRDRRGPQGGWPGQEGIVQQEGHDLQAGVGSVAPTSPPTRGRTPGVVGRGACARVRCDGAAASHPPWCPAARTCCRPAPSPAASSRGRQALGTSPRRTGPRGASRDLDRPARRGGDAGTRGGRQRRASAASISSRRASTSASYASAGSGLSSVNRMPPLVASSPACRATTAATTTALNGYAE